jgi:hypothetical protein
VLNKINLLDHYFLGLHSGFVYYFQDIDASGQIAGFNLFIAANGRFPGFHHLAGLVV